MFNKFPLYRQRDAMDCGPTCLMMIAKHYGRDYSLPYLREFCYLSREGVSALGIMEGAEKIGFSSMPVKVGYEKTENDACLMTAPMPCIAHWNQNHFVVIYKVTRRHVWIADPAAGRFKLKRADFEKSWATDNQQGVMILMDTTPKFYNNDNLTPSVPTSFSYLLGYLRPYRGLISQLGCYWGVCFN
jgi:ATP-binding cassette, subfamily B, bacterial